MEESNQKPDTMVLLTNEAVNAIINLWDKSKSTFWRSTYQRTLLKNTPGFFPTVSFRCIESLVSSIIACPGWIQEDKEKKIIDEIIPALINLDLDTIKSSLNDEEDGHTELNEFTLSLYIQAISVLNRQIGKDSTYSSKALLKLVESVNKLLSHKFLTRTDTSKYINSHPFILFHVTRALVLSKSHIDEKSIIERINLVITQIIYSIREVTQNLLAKYELKTLNPSDNVALAFCSAVFALVNFPENKQHLMTALRISAESQDLLGCWPLGRIIHSNKDLDSDKLVISTHEIAWVLALTSLELVKNNGINHDEECIISILNTLNKSLDYSRKSSVNIIEEGVPLSGWCSDPPYNLDLIESWTSANVLQFIITLTVFKEELELRGVLKSFSITHPKDKDWPKWLRWDSYKDKSEINYDFPILGYLEKHVIKPIKNHPQQLPSIEYNSVSVLLFGPPGTSKTTIVKAVADNLNWPVVMLNPGHFIEGGLESIERYSKSVFERLMKLSRCIVLFDECDELFRERSPQKISEQTRGITAFVTACMLPKLQELHDRGKVLFFVCTNNFESIDSAIKRGGRIDHIIGIGPPDRKSREKIIDASMETYLSQKGVIKPIYWDQIKENLLAKSDRYIRSELIRAVNSILDTQPWVSQHKVNKIVSSIISRFEDSLIITEEEYKKFINQNSKYSYPLKEEKKS